MGKYIIFLFLASTMLHAHDNSEFDFYGFSYDKKYCAFEMFGIEDLGDIYSNIYILDVEKNKYAYEPFILKAEYSDDDNQLWKIRIKNLGNVLPILSKLGIYPHNKGTLLFYHPRINEYIKNQTFTVFDDRYELILIEVPYKDDSKRFELRIRNNKTEIILQKDETLPISRKDANGYRLLCGYYYYGVVAIFIEYEEYGYEGNNRRQLAVTGIIKTGELPMQYD